MGSVHAYTNSKGEELYRIVYRDENNRQTSKRGFTGFRRAKAELTKIEASIQDGTYTRTSAGRRTVESLHTHWLKTKKVNLKPASYAALESSWRNYVAPKWGKHQVAKLDQEMIQNWVNSLLDNKSPSVVRRAHEVLAGILDTAIPKHLKVNPARGVGLPKRRRESDRRYLSHQEVWALAEACKGRETLILTLAYCGIRWGEATAIQRRDLDTKKQRIHVRRNVVLIGSKHEKGTPKNDKERHVPVPTKVWDRLLDETKGRKPTDLIFHDGYGGFMRSPSGGRSGRNWWVSALKSAGIEYLKIHDLRHTAASLAVSSGAHVKLVQRMLGHASAAMTLDTYSDLFEDDLGVLITRLDSAISGSIVVNSVASDSEEKEDKP